MNNWAKGAAAVATVAAASALTYCATSQTAPADKSSLRAELNVPRADTPARVFVTSKCPLSGAGGRESAFLSAAIAAVGGQLVSWVVDSGQGWLRHQVDESIRNKTASSTARFHFPLWTYRPEKPVENRFDMQPMGCIVFVRAKFAAKDTQFEITGSKSTWTKEDIKRINDLLAELSNLPQTLEAPAIYVAGVPELYAEFPLFPREATVFPQSPRVDDNNHETGKGYGGNDNVSWVTGYSVGAPVVRFEKSGAKTAGKSKRLLAYLTVSADIVNGNGALENKDFVALRLIDLGQVDVGVERTRQSFPAFDGPKFPILPPQRLIVEMPPETVGGKPVRVATFHGIPMTFAMTIEETEDATDIERMMLALAKDETLKKAAQDDLMAQWNAMMQRLTAPATPPAQ